MGTWVVNRTSRGFLVHFQGEGEQSCPANPQVQKHNPDPRHVPPEHQPPHSACDPAVQPQRWHRRARPLNPMGQVATAKAKGSTAAKRPGTAARSTRHRGSRGIGIKR